MGEGIEDSGGGNGGVTAHFGAFHAQPPLVFGGAHPQRRPVRGELPSILFEEAIVHPFFR